MGPEPITCNAHTTVSMIDPIKEFPELFPVGKPTELPLLRYIMDMIQYRIDVLPESHWSPRFLRTYNHLKHQITEQIYTELGPTRVVPSRSSNAIGIFAQPKRDELHEARSLLHCITRNLVTHKDKIAMPSMEQIIDCVGSRPFRSKRDLRDGYRNIRIHAESDKDSTICCQMGKYNSLVMQQGDCNAPANMMRAINFQFRNIKDLIIYLYDILIANHTYEEHIKSI